MKVFIAGPRAINTLNNSVCQKINSIWNGNSRGTFNNIVNLLQMNKEVVLYYEETKSFYHFKNLDDFKDCFKDNIRMNSKLKQIIEKNEHNSFVQVGLF